MEHNGGFRDGWRPRWRGGRDRRGAAQPTAQFADRALQAGLWAAGCLAIASLAPAALVAPLLRELLLACAFANCLAGLLHGERLTVEGFNRQDVALALLALAIVAGFFADPAALEEFRRAVVNGAGADAATSG